MPQGIPAEQQMMNLELSLLHRDFKGNEAELEVLLAEDFTEVNPTGRISSRADVINWILQKDVEARWELLDFRMLITGDDARLLVYHAIRKQSGQPVSPGARHCSLWRYSSSLEVWQLHFHQATRVS